jgi:hypothetical protein
VKPAVKPAAKPAPAPAKKIVTEKVFQGELAGSFEQALARIQPKQGNLVLGTILAVVQPIFGALPLSSKQTLERVLGDRRYFNTATATGLNVLLNMILYPAVFVAIYTTLLGGELFSQAVNKVIFLGLTLASIETVIRLRELFFYGVPIEEATFRGTWYGLFLAPLVALSLGSVGRHSPDRGQIAFDGYYAQEFDEKTERARRYGEVYTVEELGNAYLFRLELPRWIPVSAAKREMGISDEMPDYEYNLSIRDGGFIVRGSITDPQIRKLAAVSPAFPPDFTKRIDLKSSVTSFKHRYHDKTLEVVLFTQ